MYFNIADMYIYIWAVIVDFIMGRLCKYNA